MLTARPPKPHRSYVTFGNRKYIDIEFLLKMSESLSEELMLNYMCHGILLRLMSKISALPQRDISVLLSPTLTACLVTFDWTIFMNDK